MARFMIHAYIRDNTGTLVEPVFLDVCATSKDAAHLMVESYYKQKNLTAGINVNSTVEMRDFSIMATC